MSSALSRPRCLRPTPSPAGPARCAKILGTSFGTAPGATADLATQPGRAGKWSFEPRGSRVSTRHGLTEWLLQGGNSHEDDDTAFLTGVYGKAGRLARQGPQVVRANVHRPRQGRSHTERRPSHVRSSTQSSAVRNRSWRPARKTCTLHPREGRFSHDVIPEKTADAGYSKRGWQRASNAKTLREQVCFTPHKRPQPVSLSPALTDAAAVVLPVSDWIERPPAGLADLIPQIFWHGSGPVGLCA